MSYNAKYITRKGLKRQNMPIEKFLNGLNRQNMP